MNKAIESASNVSRFKEILLALHRGARPASVFEQFHEIISSASDEEYEEINREMIAEGISRKQAKKWRKNLNRTRHSTLQFN